MVFIQSLIQYSLLLFIFLGQLGRVNILGVNLNLIDLALLANVALSVTAARQTVLPKFSRFIFIFLAYSWVNLAIKIIYFGYNFVTPSLYLLRLSCLLLLFVFPMRITPRFKQAIYLTLIANILFGLFQYLLWPDLTYLKAIGWDDHLNRLVSTFFDPTFTGLTYLIFLLWILRPPQVSILITTYVALALTYSRSTYLALLASIGYLSLTTKKYSMVFVALLVIGTTVIALPRRAGEGTKLERVSSINAKSTNFQEGINLFSKYPLTGIGYNNIPYFKNSSPTSHSLGGYDASFLNILITGGVAGAILFSIGYWQLISASPLTVQSMFVAILVHSLFANSLFYPHTTILLALIYHWELQTKYRK